MYNIDIRKLAKESGVFLYDIAERLGVCEMTVTRLLRRELPDAKKAQLKEIIADLAAEKAKAKTA